MQIVRFKDRPESLAVKVWESDGGCFVILLGSLGIGRGMSVERGAEVFICEPEKMLEVVEELHEPAVRS